MHRRVVDYLTVTLILSSTLALNVEPTTVSVAGIPLTYAALDRCLLILVPSANSCIGNPRQFECAEGYYCKQYLANIKTAFSDDDKALVRYLNESQVPWIEKSLAEELDPTRFSCSLVIYKKPVLDRTCLTTPLPSKPDAPSILGLTSALSLDSAVAAVNSACLTFRLPSGNLSISGYHRQYILENLFSVQSLPNSVTSKKVFSDRHSATTIPQCERVTISSWNQFFTDYLQISKPVIISGALAHWKAKSKWSRRFLSQRYGDKKVHIKMSPTSDYEGIEPAELWENHPNFHIPQSVKSKLKFPDLVVPRPAPVNMNFSDFLELMEQIGNGTISNASAYLEYSSIRNYFPELENDISEMSYVQDKLFLRHLNIWLSDGNTLGKLHFDPYDNFLCMIDGTKELILFEPHHNHQLYESHIPEAEFSMDKKSLKFYRKKLMESTSMVMSPVDIRQPNFTRFPHFMATAPLNCTIHEGDALFMPSFWWHEVQSYPDPVTKRNLAVNYWYEPFLTKEFPCPECPLDVNPLYFHLL